MGALKKCFSIVFSLRMIVVLMAVALLLSNQSLLNQALPLGYELDQALFLISNQLLSSPDAGHLWPLNLQSDAVFRDLLQTSELFSPYYFHWLENLLISCAASFLVVVLPRISRPTGFLLTVFIVTAMAVYQITMQIFRQQWLPLGITIQFLLVGYLVMSFWIGPHQALRALNRELIETKVRLSRLLTQQGQLQDAYGVFLGCNLTEEALSTIYDIGLQQERKRQYDQAIAAYERIVTAKRSFKDVDNRLKQLKKIDEGSISSFGSTDYASTLVLPELNVGKPILGRYEIERELGRGAMGVVYLGRDPKISRTVAIKTFSYMQFDNHLLEDLKSRFFREAEAAGRLSHPNIVTVYDVGEEPDLAFIAMDYAEGKSLSHYCKPGSLLPIDEVHQLILKVAKALDYAHAQNIVHRDIKPGNIIYNPKNKDVKVTDFGIAKIVDDSKTKTGSVMGSPLYMSPEQLMGKKVLGSSDVYSLGATFYQLLSGSTPFDGDTLANLTYQIIHQKHRSIKSLNSDIPAMTTRIINKSLQKDPEKRFGSAGAMAEAIQKVIKKEFNGEVVS